MRTALTNAGSIAALMLTTEALVADIKEEKKSLPPAAVAGWEMRIRARQGRQAFANQNHMRKQSIPSTLETVRPHGEHWLDLERAAAVEVTSEEKNFPVSRPWYLEKHRAGGRLLRELKRFGCSLTNRKG